MIPISRTQDTAGPMTRSVTDAAPLSERNWRAPIRETPQPAARGPPTIFRPSTLMRLKGARLGIVQFSFPLAIRASMRCTSRHSASLSSKALAWPIRSNCHRQSSMQDSEFSVPLYEMKAGLNSYLRE
jgi:amidase